MAMTAIDSEDVTPMPSLQAADSRTGRRYTSTMTKPDRSRYQIVPIGSLHTGFALTVDGVIKRSSPDMLSLAAYVDAILAGADETDASLVAQAIAARAWPSFEERMAIFEVTGPWRPSLDPFER